LLALLAAMALALVLGYVLSGYLTRQLSLLAERVATLTPGEACTPLLKDKQDQEVAMLAGALDRYHELVLNMIRREQEFTANVSHELRTPLTAIRTSCELLAEDTAMSEKSRLRIRFIEQAATGMTDRTAALLLLAREREFRVQERIFLHECVEDVLAQFRDEIAAKGLSCSYGFPPDASIVANRQALLLVLTNLLKNAVLYTETGGIDIRYAEGRLAVSDTGIGIPAERLSHIFERHYRGAVRDEGVGLGLDIVKKVCALAGWTVTVSSVPGRGTTFTLLLA
jgi:signal transduction histidine kinase